MCGIIVTKDQSKILQIAHRGLESDYRYNTEYDMHFAHVRLPIQTVAGDTWGQPYMINDDLMLLFNGEIFNYDTECYENDVDYLRSFFTYNDTFEKIISPQALGRINMWDGFWSIVLVNFKTKEVVVFTDPIGKKQLYYNTNTYEICSEINPLKNHFSRYDEIYKSMIYKWGYNANDRTPYNNIKRFLPNTIYSFSLEIYKYRGNIEHFKIRNEYFSFDRHKKLLFFDTYQQGIRLGIEESVKNRLISKNYPISLLLSGGIDSTIILYHLKQLDADVTIYSVQNEEDEQYIKVCEEFFGVKVNYLSYDLETENLKQIYTDFNETPIDLGSVVPQYKLFSQVKTRICLTGDGSDELFGGYRRAWETDKAYDSQGSDVLEELSYYHLPRLDRASMRYTIELRNPFLGLSVIKQAFELPYEYRKNKLILKRAYEGLVPAEILYRNKLPLKNPQIRENKLDYRKKVIDIFYGGN